MAKKRVRVVLYGPAGGMPLASVWGDLEQYGAEGGHRITLLHAYTDLRPERGWHFITGAGQCYQIEGSVQDANGGNTVLLCREVVAAPASTASTEEDR